MALTKTPIELSSTPGIVDNSNATAITIDASENVGIGSTTVNRKLEVAGNNNGGAKANYIRITDTDTTATANNQAGGIEFFTNDVTAGIAASIEVLYAGSGGGGEITFNTNASSSGTLTEALRIDESGNVGIGISSPNSLAHVYGGSSGRSWTPDGADKLALEHNDSVAFDIRTPNNKQALILFSDADARARGIMGYAHASDHMYFSTAGTERMRINAAGQLLIGTTTGVATGTLATSGLEIVAPSGQDAIATQVLGGATCFGGSGPTTSSQTYLFGQMINSSGSTVGSIVVSASATAYNTSSDYRLKENVVAISNATERLKQLNPSRFNFIEVPDTTVDGFLAHEVADVVPEAISGTKDAVDADGNPAYQGIDQSKLVPLLVATIQELEARLTALENN